MDYKQTLNLPRTAFPMKANLAQNEPKLLAYWQEINLYQQLCNKKAPRGKYTLHDGPPYANGNIHIGHALNKILKDIIVKAKTMAGYNSHYIPGWDCHGLPIEHQVDKKLGKEKYSLDTYQKRQLCRDYAQKFIDIQREEFKRLGIFGDWDNPYLTMDYGYEATIVRQLGQIVANGLLSKGRKPVHWCTSCSTALAEAEVEYQDHKSPSIYIKFPLTEKALETLGVEEASIVIWTTTPWTLPANRAVALHPDFDYVLVKTPVGNLILADGLSKTCMQKLSFDDYQILQTFKGQKLEGQSCRHPFFDRQSKIILAPYVTLEQGTGCVHTAPGHGQEDYMSGVKYGLEIYNPVDERGRFVEDLPLWGGEFVFKANPLITEHCRENGTLLYTENISHSYPHCWRCKNPLIFRATEQWFISMDERDLRQRSLDEIDRVQWIPHWGKERIYNMIANRPDWCISRQRSWGVPITVFYCDNCHHPLMDARVIDYVADIVAKEGSDVWFYKNSEELLPAGTVCPDCKGKNFTKEMDILDVWFDSGVSHAAVLIDDTVLNNPADLYLEGSDQHRGWFHSSLLTGVANQGKAPYHAVLTHGFVVDGKGKKMSKSMGNVIAPQKIIERNGAEVLRLWVSSANYREDVRISQEIIQRLTEGYRRIRNTCRFLLGNTSDFNPSQEALPYDDLLEIDRWALYKLQELVKRITKAYQDFEFHVIYHSLHNFCAVTLSANYLDILKDRLYCSAAASRERRSAQTVLFEILLSLTRLMAPILSFTAEEVWQCLPEGTVTEKSVHLSFLPEAKRLDFSKELVGNWDLFLACRSVAYNALEIARGQKQIGSFMEAQVILYLENNLVAKLKGQEDLLAEIFLVSAVKVKQLSNGVCKHKVKWGADREQGSGSVRDLLGSFEVGVDLAEGEKCERCWNYRLSVGQNTSYPTLCTRCAEVITQSNI